MNQRLDKNRVSGFIIAILERIEETKERYNNAKKGLDVNGRPLKSDGGFIRTRELRERNILCLVRDLLKELARYECDIPISESGLKGLEKLLYPTRRHTIKGD